MDHHAARDIRTILLPTDFSDTAEDATEMAVRLAQRLGARILCVHVVDVPAAAESALEAKRVADDERRAEQMLSRLAQALHRREITAEMRLAVGTPHAEIVRIAREEPADLVVIGTHGRRGLTRALLGSVAEQVLRDAPCPVLTVRPGTIAAPAAVHRPEPSPREPSGRPV